MDDKSLNKLDSANLEGVAGGYVIDSQGELNNYNPDTRWQVIEDRTGNVLASFPTAAKAEEYARMNGQSQVHISKTALDMVKTGFLADL